MLCQCTLDACLDSALECILFSEPRDGLTRLALGAYEGILLENCVALQPGHENDLFVVPVCIESRMGLFLSSGYL